ncbi:MAG: SIS domain-containing protein [Rhodoferax sp.]
MPSWMLQEALSCADHVETLLAHDTDTLEALGAALRAQPPQGVLTLARGSSDHAASYLAYLVMARTGQLVTSLPMSLLTLYGAPLAQAQRLAIAVSQSGRSPDLVEPLQHFRRAQASTVALVNDAASPLAQAAQWVLPLHAGPERSVAATKSFVASLVGAARLVAHWTQDRDLLDALPTLPATLRAACAQDWSGALPVLHGAQRLLVLGRGPGLALAQEAALKFKETCALQAEAFSAAEVQHGPMALVDEGYPLLVFALRGPAQDSVVAQAQAMRARGARVLLAAPPEVPERDLTLVPSACPDLDAIAAIGSFYPLVEALARARGLDPDQPRHLRKVTTTR